jgi:hypothetical protein
MQSQNPIVIDVIVPVLTFPAMRCSFMSLIYAPSNLADPILRSGTIEQSITTSLTVEQCAAINFGAVVLDVTQTRWLDLMNRGIVDLCRTMPAAMQDSALLAIQKHFTGFQLKNLLNFFTKFYVPSWSLIAWMYPPPGVVTDLATDRSMASLSVTEQEDAIVAQGLAYFLHMLDDHIADGQIPISHLLLQLRTHAWTRFTQTAAQLALPLENGSAIIQTTLDRYFAGIHDRRAVEGLAAYTEQFRQQLSTTLVMPLVIAHRTGSAIVPMQQSYEAFCIAWRLLDDLRDCAEDTFAGQKSAIYHLLTPQYQALWAECVGQDDTAPAWRSLKSHLETSGILPTLVQETIGYLETAAQQAETAGLVPYAQEMLALSLPLKLALVAPTDCNN